MNSHPFNIRNLPFGVISTRDDPNPRCAVAIGEAALELTKYLETHPARDIPKDLDMLAIFREPTLNRFAELPLAIRRAVRQHLIKELSRAPAPPTCLVPLAEVTNHLPMRIGGYVDFFCSIEHARNCAALTGGAVAPNFYSSPLCYNGRASSVVPSPTAIHRPRGISYDTGGISGDKAVYGPSRKLDFELEVGYFVSKPLSHGETLKIEDAREHLFGFVLLNDWSSRDIQAFEMRPLGPFHSKGFGTSISPWIVTMDALEPFAVSPKYDHSAETFEHLRWKENGTDTFKINLKASIIRGGKQHVITEANFCDLYWTPFQQITHLAAAGSGMASGDLIGSGTISGEVSSTRAGTLGSLFEATRDGSEPILLDGENTLAYLQDFDEVILEAWCCNADGELAIGFGECRGKVLPAA
ncbi:putative fumarylacetoacetate hydrolase [Thozetella sp. PMI_491]|nr:putative fumarylacetoacetate hydrolase [Thozetella sp. PMI_491]